MNTSFDDALAALHAAPLWTSLEKLVPAEPATSAIPFIWRYSELRPLLMRAGTVVSAEEAERRVLMLLNPTPEVAARGGTTPTLYAGMQLVLPHERAETHRHVASAVRFVVEADEHGTASTLVDGQRVPMCPGDLVLTPSWSKHGHANDGDQPAIWLDGLDLPLVNLFDASFLTKADDAVTESAIDSAASTSQPAWHQGQGEGPGDPPCVRYPWSETEALLREELRRGGGSRSDGAITEYTNPSTGRPVTPTISCFAQAIGPGQRTSTHRHTPSVVYYVVRGSGATVIDGEEVAWRDHDVFCVPSWSAHRHENRSRSDPAFLFSFGNHVAYRALGLYREIECDDDR